MAAIADRGLAVAALALCLLLPAALPATWQGALEYHRSAILDGQIWRLWTGHLVHFTASQALLDGLACLVSWAWLWRAGDGHRLAAKMLLAAPAISVALLLLNPDLLVYRGASALAMFLAVPAVFQAWHELPDLRWPLALLATAVVGKTLGEALGVELAMADLSPGVRVAWWAHVVGLGLGLLLAAAALVTWRKPAQPSPGGHQTTSVVRQTGHPPRAGIRCRAAERPLAAPRLNPSGAGRCRCP